MEAKNKFYDIHIHIMDLSHANITAFINRFLNEDSIENKIKSFFPSFWKKVKFVVAGTIIAPITPLLVSIIPHSLLAKLTLCFISKEFVNKTRNLLSFMESSILYDFLILEHFLKTKDKIVNDKNEFSVGGNEYNKIVLCPLIMDFGYKSMENNDIFYDIPPQKPITSQIKDLFASISTYYNNDLHINNTGARAKFKVEKTTQKKGDKLFEIYPFMGINTKNYTLLEIQTIITKYFSNFKADDKLEEREGKLFNKMGTFNGDLEDKEACKDIFAGIKVYPPLGFEPWPTNANELAKVEYLYKNCVDKNIPIITHCSTGGFSVTNKAKQFTDPNTQWTNVLAKYPTLKLDFAHFGSGDKKWTEKIVQHIIKEDSNVYADFSSNAESDKYYKELKTIITENNNTKLNSRILFGSDFMINLLKMKSYNEYLKYFDKTTHLTQTEKQDFANSNSRNFLFK